MELRRLARVHERLKLGEGVSAHLDFVGEAGRGLEDGTFARDLEDFPADPANHAPLPTAWALLRRLLSMWQ